MGHNLVTQKIVDSETGELIKENNFFYYDGFNDKGYKYRGKQNNKITVFPDTIPTTLSERGFLLLYMLTEIANEDNVLVYRVKRKSKFSSIVYMPLDKEDIAKQLRYKWGINKFDKYWNELKKHCIKRIRYHEYMVWAINPAVMNRCTQIPPWLYEEFSVYMNPHMSKAAILKYQNMISEYKK